MDRQEIATFTENVSEYHIKTSISYRENCCTYQLPVQIYNNKTEKEVIFRFQDLIKSYKSQLKNPIYNEEELTITISLFKIPDEYDIPILIGCYDIEKYSFQKSVNSGFVISNNDLKNRIEV